MSDKDIKDDVVVEENIDNQEIETPEEQAVETTEETAETVETAEEEVVVEPTPEEIIADLKTAVLRKTADFDNFRKRTQRDLQDARTYSRISTLEEFIPVYDNFKMAMMATEGDNVNLEMLVMGMQMIQNGFTKAFQDLGVEEIDATGQEFDVHNHDAVQQEYSDEVEEGKVIAQQRRGYRIGEKLIRPATVIVSKGPEPEVTEEETTEEESEA